MEVTELGVVGRHAAETLHVLHNEGIRIALDDFGAGFASFSALSELPLDILKIDQSLTWAVSAAGRAGDRAFMVMESIADIARKLGLDSIAEGVEPRNTQPTSCGPAATWARGYYFGKPLPASSVVTPV